MSAIAKLLQRASAAPAYLLPPAEQQQQQQQQRNAASRDPASAGEARRVGQKAKRASTCATRPQAAQADSSAKLLRQSCISFPAAAAPSRPDSVAPPSLTLRAAASLLSEPMQATCEPSAASLPVRALAPTQVHASPAAPCSRALPPSLRELLQKRDVVDALKAEEAAVARDALRGALWEVALAPRDFSEVIGHTAPRARVERFFDRVVRGETTKTLLVLVGPPGVGKSSVIALAARGLTPPHRVTVIDEDTFPTQGEKESAASALSRGLRDAFDTSAVRQRVSAPSSSPGAHSTGAHSPETHAAGSAPSVAAPRASVYVLEADSVLGAQNHAAHAYVAAFCEFAAQLHAARVAVQRAAGAADSENDAADEQLCGKLHVRAPRRKKPSADTAPPRRHAAPPPRAAASAGVAHRFPLVIVLDDLWQSKPLKARVAALLSSGTATVVELRRLTPSACGLVYSNALARVTDPVRAARVRTSLPFESAKALANGCPRALVNAMQFACIGAAAAAAAAAVAPSWGAGTRCLSATETATALRDDAARCFFECLSASGGGKTLTGAAHASEVISSSSGAFAQLTGLADVDEVVTDAPADGGLQADAGDAHARGSALDADGERTGRAKSSAESDLLALYVQENLPAAACLTGDLAGLAAAAADLSLYDLSAAARLPSARMLAVAAPLRLRAGAASARARGDVRLSSMPREFPSSALQLHGRRAGTQQSRNEAHAELFIAQTWSAASEEAKALDAQAAALEERGSAKSPRGSLDARGAAAVDDAA